MKDRSQSYRLWKVALGAMVVLQVASCSDSKRSAVTGTLLCHDGTPLSGARITARSDVTGNWATGTTDRRGEFQLGSVKVGDGLPPGEYYLTIVEEPEDLRSDRPARISSKYKRRTTSGLTLTVERGKRAVFNATLDPP